MSNRAADAYNRGMLPASKMVALLKKRYPKTFRGLTVAVFKEVVPSDEWHHTSCHFNETDFYSLETVFKNRFRLRLAIAAGKGRDRLLADLKKSGRKFIKNGEIVFGSAEKSANQEWFAAAVAETLALSPDDYHKVLVKHAFACMKIHFYSDGSCRGKGGEEWVKFLKSKLA